MSHGLQLLPKMNSLNIITARVSPSSSPAPTRTNSLSTIGLAVTSEEDRPRRDSQDRRAAIAEENARAAEGRNPLSDDHGSHGGRQVSEETPLLADGKEVSTRTPSWRLLPKRVATTIINSIRWVLSTLVSPGVYLIACLYDEHGNLAPLVQLKKLFGFHRGGTRKLAAEYHQNAAFDEKTGAPAASGVPSGTGYGAVSAMRHPASSAASSSAISSESESDAEPKADGASSRTRHGRSQPRQDSEEIAPARRSIRIKLHNDDALRQRKTKKAQARAKGHGAVTTPDISAQLKSPTSPVGALTKYPKTPAPPRPLIPRRQPSYLNLELGAPTQQKTLIIDLDETLIHSMSKGGRMSSGHMVEVRLSTTIPGVGGQTVLGPQHPILYYVHKRPHCDDFLRRVCKWYNLVIFTASVQEYADPVIDWLEQERKFFSARYYRQHCTFRQGAFIKDLSSVEPDLSRVMILDNSPLSYMFNQDNAIPIHGWTNDPTDKHLLHLVPLLEGLQYVSDVRAFLALRGGEDGQHMA